MMQTHYQVLKDSNYLDMTGQRNEILTRRKSRRLILFVCIYFMSTTHLLIALLTSCTNGTSDFTPTHEANPSQNQNSHFMMAA